MSRIKPVNGRIIVEPSETNSTIGGIYIPDRARDQEKPETGIIVDIDLETEHELNTILRPGLKILFNKFAATLIERASEGGKKYLIINKDSVLGIYEDEEVHQTGQ